MESSIDVPFFGFTFATFAACAIVTAIIQFARKGETGKLTYVIVAIVALVGSFLALHWDYIGVYTTDQWIKKSAIASTITIAFIIGCFGIGAGQAIYKATRKKASPAQPKGGATAVASVASQENAVGKFAQITQFVAMPSPRFEEGKRLGDSAMCAVAFDEILAQGPDAVLAALNSIEDEGFRNRVLAQWLDTSENALAIAEKFKGKAIAKTPVSAALDDFCCPDGCLHDLEGGCYFTDADESERIGVIVCKNCGYKYTMDDGVYLFGKNCGYTFRPSDTHKWLANKKQVVSRPDGYAPIDVDGAE